MDKKEFLETSQLLIEKNLIGKEKLIEEFENNNVLQNMESGNTLKIVEELRNKELITDKDIEIFKNFMRKDLEEFIKEEDKSFIRTTNNLSCYFCYLIGIIFLLIISFNIKNLYLGLVLSIIPAYFFKKGSFFFNLNKRIQE